jgi:hypothetical protein
MFTVEVFLVEYLLLAVWIFESTRYFVKEHILLLRLLRRSSERFCFAGKRPYTCVFYDTTYFFHEFSKADFLNSIPY